jgi:hypothetical protein
MHKEYLEDVLPFRQIWHAILDVGKIRTIGANITSSHTGISDPVVVTAPIFQSSASFAVVASMYPTKHK